MDAHVSPDPESLTQTTGLEHPDSCIELALVINYTYGNINVHGFLKEIILK